MLLENHENVFDFSTETDVNGGVQSDHYDDPKGSGKSDDYLALSILHLVSLPM